MSRFRIELGGRVLGAEVLAELARRRSTGHLAWEGAGDALRLSFRDGRPESLQEGDGRMTQGRAHIVAALRRLAVSMAGILEFQPDVGERAMASQGIDTLGEALVALVQDLRPAQLRGFWTLHGSKPLVATRAFTPLALAMLKLGGPRLDAPPGPFDVVTTLSTLGSQQQVGWAILVALGGLRPVGDGDHAVKSEAAPDAPEPLESVSPPEPAAASPTAPVPAQPVAAKPTSTPVADEPLPPDLDAAARSKLVEIDRAFAALETMTYYEVLSVAPSASADEVRTAYFEAAKRWHSDAYAGLPLGERARKLEAIFARVGEANATLSDAEERKGYDFLLDRKRKGLPTDVNVILEAEGLFQRGKSLVRRGQGVAALEPLKRAVELNKGEAEFWAFLGYATYLARGQEELPAALDALTKAEEMNEKLDAVYEFRGRIAHSEGRIDEAERYLKRALGMNPRNRDAERELRLIAMRKSKQPKGGSLFDRLLKR